MQLNLDTKNIATLAGWQTSDTIVPKFLENKFPTLTKLQANFLNMLAKGKRSLFVECQIKNGKSTSILFYLLTKAFNSVSKIKNEGQNPLYLILFPNASFVEKFNKKLSNFKQILAHLNIEILLEKEERNVYLDQPTIRVCLLTPQECIKMIREERIFIKETEGLVIDDLDYLISFGQANNLRRLVNHLKGKSPNFFSQNDLVIFTNEDFSEEIAKIKSEIGVPFVTLRIRKEKPEEFEPEREDAAQKKDEGAKLTQAVFNQYFFIGSEVNGLSLIFLALKYDVFPQGTLIVTQSINDAYRLLMFTDRANLSCARIYNPSHPVSLKGYNTSLFNSGQTKVLITTEEFLKDTRKHKDRLPELKGLRNLVFFKSEVDYKGYSQFLEILQGNQNYYVPGTSFDFNVLFVVPSDQKFGQRDEDDRDEEGLDEGREQNAYLRKFYQLIAAQEQIYDRIMFEPMFVDLKDIENLSYRTETLASSLTPKQVKSFRVVEMQKLLLKSKKMKEYFGLHPNEKELVLAKLNRLSKQLKQYEVRLPKEIPGYLAPSFTKEEGEQRNSRLMNKRSNSIKNNKQVKAKGLVCKIYPVEDPVVKDLKQLRTFSSHKLWKIRHRKIKKWQDKKKLVKGIYEI